MNYILGTLAVVVVILFLYAKSLYNDNKQLEENNKLIITAYESSIETLENKAKFEKEILIKKEPVIKASEKVKSKIKKGELLKTILVMILLSLLFSGCSQKVVIQKELICYELQDVIISDDVQIRVYKDDLSLFEARNEELKSVIEFYKNQNRLYKLECEKWQEDSLECFYILCQIK